MKDNQNRILQGLAQAMRAEREGRYFYEMAAAATEDSKGKEVFLHLAEEETGHFEFLRAQYESLSKTGRIDTAVRLGEKPDMTGPSPIFSERLRDRIKDAHHEMTALSVGAQLERDAELFYKREAEAVEDLEVKRFYLELAAWEATHYSALIAQADELKESYWAESGFSPF
jgi:rubrerythrin